MYKESPMFTYVAWEFWQNIVPVYFLSSDFTLFQTNQTLYSCRKILKESWNVQTFNVKMLADDMLQPLLQQMFKVAPHSWTRARRYCLHFSVASSTTVCCMLDKTALKGCYSYSFKSLKDIEVVFVYPFIANSFTDILARNLQTHRDLKKNKMLLSLHRSIFMISIVWCTWLQWK